MCKSQRDFVKCCSEIYVNIQIILILTNFYFVVCEITKGQMCYGRNVTFCYRGIWQFHSKALIK